MLDNYIKSVESVSKTLNDQSTQWDMADHETEVNKLFDVTQDLQAMATIIIDRKGLVGNQMIRPDNIPVAAEMANQAEVLQMEVKTNLALDGVKVNLAR